MGHRFRVAPWAAVVALAVAYSVLLLTRALFLISSGPSVGPELTALDAHRDYGHLFSAEVRSSWVALAALGEGEAPADHAIGNEMVFVSAFGRLENRGCGTLSVVSLQDATPVYQGTKSQSLSRMGASSTFSRIVAAPQDGGRFRYHVLDFDQATMPQWSDRSIRSNEEGIVEVNRPAIQLSSEGNTLYTTVLDSASGHIGVGEFDLSALERDQAQNLRLGQIKRFYDTEPYFYTRSVSGDRQGEVHYLGINRHTADAAIQTLDLTTGGFTGAAIPVKSMVSAEGKDMKTAYLTASVDGRYLVTNLWYSGEINLVDLEERTSRVIPLRGMTMTGGVAINRGWVNPGLLAVHAGNHVQVLRLNQSTAEVEQLASLPVDGPEYWWPPYHQVPAQVAWSTSGEQLIVSVDHEDSEFAVIDVLDEGRQLRLAKYITVCDDNGQSNNGMDILTCNGVFDAPPGPDHNTRCFAPPSTPAATQTIPEPTATVRMTESPTPVPTVPAVLMPLLMKGP